MDGFREVYPLIVLLKGGFGHIPHANRFEEHYCKLVLTDRFYLLQREWDIANVVHLKMD